MSTMAALLRDRYELLETLGVGGEARVVKALDHQHDRLVALKIRTARDDARRARSCSARRASCSPSRRTRHLPLVREDFFDGDSYVVAMDWVDGTDLATLLARSRPARTGAVERAGVSGPGGRGADAPPLAGPAGHPRRRQAGEPDPDQGRPRQARRLRPVVGAGRRRAAGPARPASARPSWPPTAAPVARERRLRAGRDGVRPAHRLATVGRAAVVGRASTPRRPSSSRRRSGSGWRPIPARRPATPGRAGRAPARRAGAPRCRPA